MIMSYALVGPYTTLKVLKLDNSCRSLSSRPGKKSDAAACVEIQHSYKGDESLRQENL